jgi:hypothetical protein
MHCLTKGNFEGIVCNVMFEGQLLHISSYCIKTNSFFTCEEYAPDPFPNMNNKEIYQLVNLKLTSDFPETPHQG